MNKRILQKAFSGASVISLAATMAFSLPVFAQTGYQYETGTNYRHYNQRDYSQGSTSPFRHYQPSFNEDERNTDFGASEFPRTGGDLSENRGSTLDFGSSNDQGSIYGSRYRDDTGSRGYYGDNPQNRDFSQYYEGRYGRPSYRNYRENMEGRGDWQNPESRSDASGQQQYGQSGRQQQFGDSGQKQYGQSDRQQRFGESGQQQYGQSDRQQRFGDSGQRQYGQSNQQQRSGQSRQQQGQGQGQDQAQWELDPQGWVRVAYDFNNDGEPDAYEWISYYELEKARESSRMRQSEKSGDQGARYGTGNRRDQFERGYYQQRSGQQGSRQQMDRIEGTIKEMKNISLSEMDEKHIIARIETNSGQVGKVDLGPERKISDLNLKKGDKVKIYGTTGSINERPVLMARGVEAKGQRVSVNRPRDLNLKSYSGQIIKTKKTALQEGTPDVLMARIRLDDGNTTIVNLGPEKELRNQLAIQEGKKVSLLARPVRIQGSRALVAEYLTVDNKSVDVDWQKSKAGTGRQNQ